MVQQFGKSIKQRKNMNHSNPVGYPPPGDLSRISFREAVKDTIRYWEGRHRFGYNVVLACVALSWVVFTWPHFRPALTLQSGLLLLVLAAIANGCYFAAYPIDIAFQRSSFRFAWKRRRWILWCAGTFFAACLACYWIADEIYPSVV